MELHINPELQARVEHWTSQTGRSADELLQDAMAGYLNELSHTGKMLDGRYDGMADGSVTPIDGEAFFEALRLREDELLKKPQ